MSKFSMICAVSLNGVIGESDTNTIPWYIPSDLKHFKEKTLNKTVIMGSRTFNSIGKVLPKRRNVVITRNQNGEAFYLEKAGVDMCYYSIQDALRNEFQDVMVCGGQHIYTDALLHIPETLYITIIDHEFDGDVRFPIAGSRFKNEFVITQQGAKYVCDSRSEWMEENGYRFQYVEFKHVP